VLLLCTAAIAAPLWWCAFWLRAQGQPLGVRAVPGNRPDGARPPEPAEDLSGPASERPSEQVPAPRSGRPLLGAPRRQAAARPPRLGRLIGRRGQGQPLTRRLVRRGPRRRPLALPPTVGAARAVPKDPHLDGVFPWPDIEPRRDMTQAPAGAPASAAALAPSPAAAVSPAPPATEGAVANPDRVTISTPAPACPSLAATGPVGVAPQIDLTDASSRWAAVTYSAVTSRPITQAHPTSTVAPVPPLQSAPVDRVLERAGSRVVLDASELSPRRAGRHAVERAMPGTDPGYPTISSILPDPRQGRRRA
jgi:hypothetical protein